MKTLKSDCSRMVMYRKPLLTIAFLIGILLAVQPVKAQDRWSLELRSGAAFATKDLGDANLRTGFGIEGTLAYRFMPHLSAYAGWGWNRFSAANSFAGKDTDFEETGYTFGLQFVHPFGASKLTYLLQAGGLYNHIELENKEGDITADSGHGLGWQVGAGLAIPLGNRWRLTPSVRYRSLSRDLAFGNVSRSVDLNYVSTGVGIGWLF